MSQYPYQWISICGINGQYNGAERQGLGDGLLVGRRPPYRGLEVPLHCHYYNRRIKSEWYTTISGSDSNLVTNNNTLLCFIR